ncbi:MAG: hypothetical protein HY761_09625 [Candidatus Omnitrophica bacterium]|nr:hypothetical protein [Candidatus Omnitrophota bacterium]
MRFKINDTIKPTASFQGSSDYYRYFKYYFDFYLSPNPDLENLDHATELYVKNAEIETLLESAYSNQSFCQMLVGHTGIGKSTIVKNYFDVMRPNPVFRDDNIIIPYYCIAHIKQKDPSKFFTSNMQTVADRLIERTGQRLDREGFWQFIDNNKPEVIRRHRIGEFKSINEDLDAVAAHDPFAYASFLIKFLLMYDCNRVFNNIILLFDDVEALDSTKRKPYIDFAYHTYSCFKNKDAPYHVKLFISERPHTRRDFHGNDWADQKPDINLWSPPRLANIIQARHNYVVKNLAPEAIKRAKS